MLIASYVLPLFFHSYHLNQIKHTAIISSIVTSTHTRVAAATVYE